MDASFAPQYIFLLKSICIMSQIPLHGSIFSMFLTEKIKSRAVRKPLPSHQEHCLAPRNRYAASLRPETVTIPQRVYDKVCGHVGGLRSLSFAPSFGQCPSTWASLTLWFSCVIVLSRAPGKQLLTLRLLWQDALIEQWCAQTAIYRFRIRIPVGPSVICRSPSRWRANISSTYFKGVEVKGSFKYYLETSWK